eukprot:TRINITY_DN934_c0_g1_i1.p1 TRINITY_DN934_c0_g1~~TRINITY_DN934_c0_g1_i1.p1  ORF type:complete len:410 (+),score=55.36 TRINITY_DN934_c0_g1_i1:916-2145(+)
MPFYAVKCNTSPALVAVLAALGAGFDCASLSEISLVKKLGVGADRIVYANPCKMVKHFAFAVAEGVHMSTFDTVDELLKTKKVDPEAKLLLRLSADDKSSKFPMGDKFGALESEVENLLHVAASFGLHVAGVSFHVGSSARDASAYAHAIAAARRCFGMADEMEKLGMGKKMSVLDIGGGFTARKASGGLRFLDAAKAINGALDLHFPPVGLTRDAFLLAEPGRYFAEMPATLATMVFGRRQRGKRLAYWINDGVYGSLNCLLFDPGLPDMRPLLLKSKAMEATIDLPVEATVTMEGDSGSDLGNNMLPIRLPSTSNASCETTQIVPDREDTNSSTVFGPTLDGVDVVLKDTQLPKLAIGDWLVFSKMGAYSTSSGTSFNGFATTDIRTFYVYSLKDEDNLPGEFDSVQ